MENKKRRTLIIGGVAGGATAAARLRRRDNDREIIVIRKGRIQFPIANCGLTLLCWRRYQRQKRAASDEPGDNESAF